MERWQGKIAVVTGSSAGIGTAVVEKLVDSGISVVGLARRQSKLDELKEKLKDRKGHFYPRRINVIKEDELVSAFKWIEKTVGPVRILVNNPGVTRITSLSDRNTQLWKDVFDTNVMGLCIATREAILSMKANGIDGHIVHINSVVGHKVFPGGALNVYGPSKYAVTALTETLRCELVETKSKIKITSISPGIVRTEIIDASEMASNIKIDDEIKKGFDNIPHLFPEDVADAVIYVLGTLPHVQTHELMIKPVGETI